MNEVLRFIQLEGAYQTAPALWSVLLALTVTLICSLSIGLVYRHTNTTSGYSQSYVQTLVMTSLVTALIMVVIGSNLARAFSLVGALSIIRFRNAVKETRDVGYIFFSLAVAMAAGTRFYGIAVVATLFISLATIGMHYLNFGQLAGSEERYLRVRFPAGIDPEKTLRPILEKHFYTYSLVATETARQGMYVDSVFSVRQSSDAAAAEIVEEITELNENLKVVYQTNTHTSDV